MINTYKVLGVSWSRCKISTIVSLFNGLKEKLSYFQHKNKEVLISKDSQIEEQYLQKIVLHPQNTQLQNHDTNYSATSTKDEIGKRDLKQLFPLFLISNYILITALLLNMNSWHISNFILDFIGLFYVVFSVCKLFDLKGFPKNFRLYDPLANAVPAYAWAYPFIEVSLGFMLLMRFHINSVLLVMLVILSITTCGVIKALFNKKSIQCTCIGTAVELPMTKATLIKNTVLTVLIVTALFNSILL